MNIDPPSCGFPPQPYPLKGHPRLREDTFGTRAQVLPMRRLSGGAMLCHLQCARFANRRRIAGVRPSLPSALTRSPPVAAPTPNKRPSGIGGDLFSSRSRVCGVSRAELIPLNGDILIKHTNDTRRGTPRAAQPSVHRRCNRRLNTAARSATSRARRQTKQTRA